MSLTDHNGFPIFTCPASQDPPLLTRGDEAPPASVPALVRAARPIPEYATPWRVLEGTHQGSDVAAVLDAGGRTLFFVRSAVVAWEIVTDRNRGRR